MNVPIESTHLTPEMRKAMLRTLEHNEYAFLLLSDYVEPKKKD